MCQPTFHQVDPSLAVALMVGLLLSLSAGVRMTLPLLAVNLLAINHLVPLPENMAWLGTPLTSFVLAVAFTAETGIHFIPAIGTGLKAMATPLAFVAGTILMAVPLGEHDHNPLFQWALAAAMGGGAATLTHLGVTGARTLTGPANVASLGMFGVVWNIGEFLVSILLTVLGAFCFFAGWVIWAVALVALFVCVAMVIAKGVGRFRRTPAIAQ